MNDLIHPKALVETTHVGDRTRVWAGAHLLPGSRIGNDCNVGDLVFIEGGVVVGDRVTLKNGAMLFDGLRIADDAFIGPGAIFTNDRFPRSPRAPVAATRYARADWLEITIVEQGATIGARSVICPGVTIGEFSTIGAGSVVTGDVSPHALMVGAPARRVGWVCRCGLPTAARPLPDSACRCPA